jgi:hypothetical protein
MPLGQSQDIPQADPGGRVIAQSFSTAYTSGGVVFLNVFVTLQTGTGGSPAGGGYVRVKIQWLGAEEV